MLLVHTKPQKTLLWLMFKTKPLTKKIHEISCEEVPLMAMRNWNFIALNGKTYRSTWSVKRARAKLDGALQAVEMRLENLRKEETNKGKDRNTCQNSRVDWIEFEQFTRAVLLMQDCDFWKQNKAKSELLEKLTGTHIYSQISARIYEKTQQAKQELTVLSGKRWRILSSFGRRTCANASRKNGSNSSNGGFETPDCKHQQTLGMDCNRATVKKKEVSVAENDWVTLKDDLENAKQIRIHRKSGCRARN